MENINAACTTCAKQFYVPDPLHPKGPKVPLVIGCGHPVCEKCLSAALRTNQKIVCSKCDGVSTGSLKGMQTSTCLKELTQQYPIHRTILGTISDNYSQRPIVDQSGIRFHPAGTSVTVQKSYNKYQPNQIYSQPRKMNPCSECQLQAMWTCKQCIANFCGVCFNKVHQFKANRNHEKIPLVASVAAMFEKEEVKETVTKVTEFMCAEHPTHKLDFYCRDCKECACSLCIIPTDSIHRLHNIMSVMKMNEECMPKLILAMDDVKVVLTNLINAKKALESANEVSKPTNEDQAYVNINQVAQQVVNHFAWAHGVLQQKEASILKTLKEIISSEKERKRNLHQQVTDTIELVTGLYQAGEETVKNKQPSGFGGVMPLIQELNKLNNLPCQLITKTAGKVEFSIRESFAEELSNHCDIDIPSTQDMLLAKIGFIEEGWVEIAVPECLPLDLSCSPSVASPASSVAPSVCGSDTSEHPPTDTHVPIRGFIPARTREVVKLCHMTNPSNFFILRIPDDRFLKDLSQKLQKSVAKQRQPIPNQVKEGQLLLVEYNSDHNWYRGRITSVRLLNDDGSDGLVEVVYIDYGNTDVVPMKRLRNLPPEFTNIPPLAIRCRLANIYPLGNNEPWSEEAIKFFAKCASDYSLMCTVYKVSNGFHWVDIGEVPGDGNRSIPISITDALLFLEYGQMMNEQVEQPMPNADIKRPTVPKAIEIPYNTRFRAVLSHVENPQHFYCQAIDDTTQYITSISTDLTAMFSRPKKPLKGLNPKGKSNYKEDILIYAPTIGMSCAALYPDDGRWYRATVLARPGRRKVRVQYLDYGNTDTIDYTQLRLLPDKYMRLPALSVLCSLADVVPAESEWSPQAKQYMVRLLTDAVLTCRVINEPVDTSLQLLVYDIRPTMDICINSLLVHVGLARSVGPASEHPFKVVKVYDESDADDGLQLETTCESEEAESAMIKLMEEATSELPKPVVAKKKPTPKKGSFAMMPVEDDLDTDFAPPKIPGGYMLVPVKTQPENKPRKAVKETSEKAAARESKDPYRMEVKIVKVFAPDNFFVTFMSVMPHIENMNDEMDQFYENSLPLKDHQWNLGDRCAVLVDQVTWKRGCCVRADVEGYMMVAIPDIPDKVYVRLEDMRILDPRFMRIRDGTLKCHLAGITPAGGGSAGSWSKMAIEHMTNFLAKHKFEPMFVSKKGEIEAGSLPVDLSVCESFTPGPLDPTITRWISLNVNLVEKGLAIPIRGANQVPTTTSVDALRELEGATTDLSSWSDTVSVSAPSQTGERASDEDTLDEESIDPDELDMIPGKKLRDWLPVTPLTLIAVITIPTYVDNEGFIYFHDLVEGKATIDMIQKKLQEKFSATQYDSNWKWAPGETCIAQYHLDKQWYRARTIRLERNGDWTVVFVDYGNEETCKLSEMRRSDYLAEYPLQCHKSFLENVGPIARDNRWTEKDLDYLHSLVVDQRCTFYIKSPAGTPEPVKVQVERQDGLDVQKAMVDTNHARRIGARPSSAQAALPTVSTGAIKKASPKKPVKSLSSMIGSKSSMPLDLFDMRHIPSSDEDSLVDVIFESEITTFDKTNERGLKSWYDETKEQDKPGTIQEESDAESTVETYSPLHEDTSGDESESTKYSQLFSLNPCLMYPYRQLSMPAVKHTPLLVRGVLSPTEVVIHLTNTAAMDLMVEIKALESVLANEAPKQPQLYKPVPGMPCVANFLGADGDRWYRAVVTGVSSSGSRIGVLSVDRGYTSVMAASSVVQLKPEWSASTALLLRAHLALKYTGDSPGDTILQMLALVESKELTANIKRRDPLLIELLELDGKTLVYQDFIDAGEYALMDE